MNQELKDRLRRRGICVIIPTYNNEGTVADVVEQTLQYCSDVIVVMDGCSDSTAQRLVPLAQQITLVSDAQNRGKGHALREGFRRALSMGFAYAITLDSDGQHLPSDIPLLLEANLKHPGCLIVGERDLKGVDRSGGAAFANRFSNFWFFVQTGRRLADTQTGYRLYPLKHLHGLSLLTSRYEAELELMVMASWHGTRLVSVPIHVYYPPRAERVSHFRPGKDFARISAVNAVLCVLAVVYGLPLALLRGMRSVLRTLYSLLFFLVSMAVVTPVVGLYMRVGKTTERKRQRLHELLCWMDRFLMYRHGIPGVRFSKQVPPGLDLDQPRMWICNHQSHLDLVCLLLFTPRVIFLTNDWAFHNPFYGYLIRQAGYLPSSMGMEELTPRLRSLVERGYSIALFPEGTRSLDCSIGRFHKGAFYIARQLGLEVLPILTYGPGKVLSKHGRWLHPGPIHMKVGEPLNADQLNGMGGLLQQAREVRRRYIEEYKELQDKIEQDV